ncbi:MAG: tRNA sulfurtransferase, partial [Candidatus Thorarchaeota archaeon]
MDVVLVSYSVEPDQVLVRYGEIGLKSLGIRQHLEMLLRNHLTVMLTRSGAEYSKITRERGRFFIHTSNTQAAAHAASRVFGVVSTSPVWTTSSKPTKIVKLAKQLAPQILSKGQSFAIRARRLKTHPFTSQEIAAKVGAAIIEATTNKQTPISVDLDNPDVEVHIEIREKSTYLFTEIMKGPGGLPYGSQGTVIGLHSGGIDSPVAQWLMMKRGTRVIPLYFDSDLPGEKKFRIRAIQSATRLAEWIPVKKTELLIIPYYE